MITVNNQNVLPMIFTQDLIYIFSILTFGTFLKAAFVICKQSRGKVCAVIVLYKRTSTFWLNHQNVVSFSLHIFSDLLKKK